MKLTLNQETLTTLNSRAYATAPPKPITANSGCNSWPNSVCFPPKE